MNGDETSKDDAIDVLVIGAGMAGLAAARGLASAGLRVLVLEAEGRIGGRIFTRRVGSEVVEFGAEFVHGRPLQLLDLIKEAGLKLVERDGASARFQHGLLGVDARDGEAADFEQESSSLLEDLKRYVGPDLSFAELLSQKTISTQTRAETVDFVEGFNAADYRVISVLALGVQQAAEDAIEGGRAFHIAGGYDQLPKFLETKLKEARGQVLLHSRVRRLVWSGRGIIATVGEGDDYRSFSARRAIVALPLGVLQRGEPEFQPALPERFGKLLAADGPARMGHALRFTLIFKESFWANLPPQPDMRSLSFLHTPNMVPPVWWTPNPEISHAITGWIGGPRSAALDGLSADMLADQACKVLAQVFQVDVATIRGLLIGCYTHDWSADVSSYGAYSYIAKGGLEAQKCFTEPVEKTIYFAGEHTTTDGHWGTVHAALSSGTHVASQIKADISAESCDSPVSKL